VASLCAYWSGQGPQATVQGGHGFIHLHPVCGVTLWSAEQSLNKLGVTQDMQLQVGGLPPSSWWDSCPAQTQGCTAGRCRRLPCPGQVGSPPRLTAYLYPWRRCPKAGGSGV